MRLLYQPAVGTPPAIYLGREQSPAKRSELTRIRGVVRRDETDELRLLDIGHEEVKEPHELPKGGNTMRSQKSWMAFILLLALLTVFATGCRVRQTEEGELPDVDVSAEGGKVPEYDVDAADVDVGTEKKEVTVPDVDVNMPGEDKADDTNEEEKPPQP
jgi:hypothetical protein